MFKTMLTALGLLIFSTIITFLLLFGAAMVYIQGVHNGMEIQSERDSR